MHKVSGDGLPLGGKKCNGTILVVLSIIKEPLSTDSSEFPEARTRKMSPAPEILPGGNRSPKSLGRRSHNYRPNSQEIDLEMPEVGQEGRDYGVTSP